MTQTVRTFWQGGSPSLYQHLAFKSFADRGCRVEVFSYDPSVDLPRWIVRRDAAEVLPPERVLRFLPAARTVRGQHRSVSLCAAGEIRRLVDRSRCGPARRSCRTDEIFLAGPDAFGALSTGGAAVSAAASRADDRGRVRSRERGVRSRPGRTPARRFWRSSPSGTACRRCFRATPGWRRFRASNCRSCSILSQTQAVDRRAEGRPFLDLHYDVWLHAGVPVQSRTAEWVFAASPVAATQHRRDRPSIEMNYGDLVQLFAGCTNDRGNSASVSGRSSQLWRTRASAIRQHL